MKTQSKKPQAPVSGDPGPKRSREEIIESYLPLVRRLAEKIHRRLPPGIDQESLVHAGVVGLLEALDRYDYRRGVPFEDYARYRIQGEVMQCLRSLDWVSRSVRAWGRRVAAVLSKLAGQFGREPTSEEMADELGISLDEYYRMDRKVREATLLSLDELSMGSDEVFQKIQQDYWSNPFQDPVKLVEGKGLVEKLGRGIQTLPERERLVITLYYYEELTLKEIGQILNLSEGRICQVHNKAISQLRQALVGIESRKSAGRGTRDPAQESQNWLVRKNGGLKEEPAKSRTSQSLYCVRKT
ncbi:MAG: FliA/WhiG family RNA polymerase sigma factor [Deltaproteobacteria bacterium]|nr:FliA/WhiG family RNA polymerase sigma factor [Deltaproteobacteria bacterium]